MQTVCGSYCIPYKHWLYDVRLLPRTVLARSRVMKSFTPRYNIYKTNVLLRQLLIPVTARKLELNLGCLPLVLIPVTARKLEP